jgi:calcium-dependent protein kinase
LANSVTSKNEHTFAVKTFHTKGMNSEKLSHLQAEIEIFLCMDHPQVARLVDVYEGKESINLVMECMAGGELFDRVTKCKRFTEKNAAEATKQILLAVSYLHNHGVVHRDLKLENFLYDNQGSTHLKLIDFGFSKFYDTKSRMRTSCGTLAYVAPEVLHKSYTSQCDLWSIGVIVFILLSGHMPFYGKEKAQLRDITEGNYKMKQEHWRGVSSVAKTFVCDLLHMNPERRLTAKTALQHEWIIGSCEEPQLDLQPTVSALRHWLAAPQLLRACYSMMAWTLDNVQQSKVRDNFLALDTNHDGAVSLTELKSVMVDQYEVPEEEVNRIFAVFVAAHDQEIHYSDFLAAMACEQTELDDDLLCTTFSKFDTNGSGYITDQDLHEVLGASLEGGHAMGLVRQADKHQNGGIDFIDFAEYIRSSRLKLHKAVGGQTETCSLFSQECPPPVRAPTLLEAQRLEAQRRRNAEKDLPKRTVSCGTEQRRAAALQREDACCNVM